MLQGGGTSTQFFLLSSFQHPPTSTSQDFTKRNGTGGESIYGGRFPDEDLSRPLDSEGYVLSALSSASLITPTGCSVWLTRAQTPTILSSSSPSVIALT